MSLKETEDEVLAVLPAGRYLSGDHQVSFGMQRNLAVKNTRLCTPAQLDQLRLETSQGESPVIEVIDGTTQVVANATAKLAISRHGSAFEKIVFAISGTGRQSLEKLNVFQATFV